MKRIGVISDTHIPKAASDLPEAIYREFGNVDMILHAGDLTEMVVLRKLEKIAPTHAVYGNMDVAEVQAALPQKDVIKINGFRIGLIHGYGSPAKLAEIVGKEFSKVNVIVYGHAHSPVNEIIKNTLYFNPGSPTDKVFAAYNTFGILEIDNDIVGRIIRL